MCTGCLTGQCHPDLLGKQGPGRRRRPRTPPPRGRRRRGCAPGSRRPTPPRPSWRPPGGSWRRRRRPRRPSWALPGSRRRRRTRLRRPRRPPREPRTRAAPSATMRRRARGTRSRSRRAQQEGPFSPCVCPTSEESVCLSLRLWPGTRCGARRCSACVPGRVRHAMQCPHWRSLKYAGRVEQLPGAVYCARPASAGAAPATPSARGAKHQGLLPQAATRTCQRRTARARACTE